jgi:glycosyltransferase involved in cell wall biosynthesis
VPAPASPGPAQTVARVALVVGTTAGGTGAHVRMLAAGLAGRGIDVAVLGPASAEASFGFGAVDGVTFSPVEFGDRPRASDGAAVLRLRRLLRPVGHGAGEQSAVVHAHGLRAGALTVLALAGPRGRARPVRQSALVVTVHNASPVGGCARVVVYRLLERIVARGADLVLCVSPDLEARMRSAGARRVRRAIVPAPVAPPTPNTHLTASASPVDFATGRPVVLAVGRLAAQKDVGTLIEATVRWRDLDPPPLLAIAGDGPLAAELRAQAAALGVDAAFLGHRDDVPDLLAAATVFVLPSRWEGQPHILQEALRAGAAIVATRVGGIPDLVGDDAAMLVGPGDAAALAAAVRVVLENPSLASRLRAAAAARGAALPTAVDAVVAALAAYADARRPT